MRPGGHDAVHVRDLGLQAADDEQVMSSAARDDRVRVRPLPIGDASTSSCEA